MLNTPMDVLRRFPVRKSKQQKQAFREEVQAYCQGLGYEVTVEKGSFGARNLIIGDPKCADYLVTAHYDTCARMPIPNLVAPCNLLVLLLYQLLLSSVLYLCGILISAVTWPLLCLIVLTINGNVAEFMEALAIGLVFLPFLGVAGIYPAAFMFTFGPANPSNANDNTSGVVTLLEIARTMPENQRRKVAFVLFDLEEAGLLGSAAYRKAHKAETNRQIILNMDCVGDGDEILLIPSKKLCKDEGKLRHLCSVVSRNGRKTIAICNKGFRFYPSDQTNFPYGVAIAAFHRKKGVGLYYSRIHTAKDTVLDETNVNLLRAALTSLICN